MTNISMLALARHQTAKIPLFVATTNSPYNTRQKRHQAKGHCIDGTSLHGRFKGNDHPIIMFILKYHSSCPERPLFNFEMKLEAAEKFFMILKSFDFNIGRAIEAQAKSPMGYGSEFRKGRILFPLPRNHPLWLRMKDLLEFGS